MGLTVVGTLKANRALLPPELTTADGRQPGSSLICHRNDVQLASFCPKPKKVVLVASSQHRQPMVDSVSKKPEVVLYYNSTKGGIDVCDAIVESTICKAALRRWPTRVLLYLISVANLNAFHLFCLAQPTSDFCDVLHGGRMRFLRSLAMKLLEPQLERRVELYQSHGVLNAQTTAALRMVLDRPLTRDAPPAAAPAAAAAESSKGRCHLCVADSHGAGHKRRKNSLGRVTKCSVCARSACREHSIARKVCHECSAQDDE